ncbi:histidine phosphatase family protein [Streptacidiphilus sp. N1-3]|uniref:Histidine phosphatase family protein n=1 Tax=Streptacidiphilus alkalitolerans TaxID=3342712 RepID=A0ABV6XCP0_9ACTN
MLGAPGELAVNVGRIVVGADAWSPRWTRSHSVASPIDGIPHQGRVGSRPRRAEGVGGTSARVRVWCLRHGESENVTRGVAGAVPSAPLTERGHQQAAAVARTLAGEAIGAVYCSTAVRARQTAMPTAAAVGVDIQALPDLVEVGDGETGYEVTARMAKAFQAVADQHRGETVAVVGHVAGLTVAIGRLCALGAEAATWPQRPDRPRRGVAATPRGGAFRCRPWVRFRQLVTIGTSGRCPSRGTRSPAPTQPAR